MQIETHTTATRVIHIRFWLRVITGAIFGGGFLIGIIAVVYVLGGLIEGLAK